jgi:hypothetical protein
MLKIVMMKLFCLLLVGIQSYIVPFKSTFLQKYQVSMSTTESPVVKNIDKETNVAKMIVTLSGDKTQKAFAKSCELFNEVSYCIQS